MNDYVCPPGVEVTGHYSDEFAQILTPDALKFTATIIREFAPVRQGLLQQRAHRQADIDAGILPDFLSETGRIREANWTIDPVPADLRDRRVEITGPSSDRKMVINAFNSGAHCFMADFEDANSPTWANTIQGQINLRDAIRRTIDFTSPEGKHYALNEQTATLIVRPRGWHLTEKHVIVDGEPAPAGIFDFALFLYHNVHALQSQNSGPYFYLPKLESHLEARLWNDIFSAAERTLEMQHGTIKATVLIETILAAFEMDEILYELRHHAAGLNCGRWDYIFSYIKKLCNRPNVLLPDRAQVTMTTPFMRSYSLLAIQTCHKRGAHCIGGMAAQIPVKNDETANADALAKVRADKEREAQDGHDGTWVAHPALVPVAMAVFDEHMPASNQLSRTLPELHVTAADLLAVPQGTITEVGLRTNLSVGIQYIEAWLRGFGAVPIFNLMEDAATAEISRAQVWQWIRHQNGVLTDGRKVTVDLCKDMLTEEQTKVEQSVGATTFQTGRYKLASELFMNIILADEFVEFLTLPGYSYLD